MLRVPPAAGPWSQALVEILRGRRASVPEAVAVSDPCRDRDLQLALYVANELHYTGLVGVDDDLEWDPAVTAIRTSLEEAMLEQLTDECGPVASIEPERVPDRIFDLVGDDESPSLAHYLETQADLNQFREFVMHRSAYQLKEADPHTFAIPRVGGAAKAAMIEIQTDEYGGGDPSRMHSVLFAETMRTLGLSTHVGAYVPSLPAETLATVNLMTLFGLRRSWRGALVGHLAGFEITSPGPNRRYAKGLRRLGFGPSATEFFDEHVEADSVHENIAAYDLAGGLARQEPDLAGQIVFGVKALLWSEGRFAGQSSRASRPMKARWSRRRSSP